MPDFFHSPSPQIIWTVDILHISLVHRETRRILRLSYPDALLWDLLYRRFSRKQILGQIMAVADWDHAFAEKWIDEKISQWVDGGWLIAGDVHG